MRWLLLLSLVGCAERPLWLPSSGSGSGGSNGGNTNGGGGSTNGGGGSTNGGGGSTNGGGGNTNGGGNNSGTPPRLLSPLSTSTVTSRRPTLRWDPIGSAEVDLCADRGCSSLVGSVRIDRDGVGHPDAELPPGTIFWRVRAGGLSSAVWEFFVGRRSAGDSSWGATLELDGDGVPDVAAGISGGGVALYLGGEGSPQVLPNPDDPRSNFGFVVAAAGDLDGDGLGDLAVGECGQDDTRVHVYFGAAGGVRASSQALDSPDGTRGFGCRVAGAGDLDGDGYGDLAVARVGNDFGGGLYIYKGGPNGLPSTTTRIDSPDYKPSRLGYSLAAVGDLDGDGFADLLASEIDYSALGGRIHLYFGGAGGISNQRVTTLVGGDPSGIQFGASVAAAGDVDGDGFLDYVVGAPAVATTMGLPVAHLFYGGGSRVADLPGGGALGFAAEVEGAGDLDGDGYSDLVVTAGDSLTVFVGPSLKPFLITAAGQGANPRHASGAGDLDGDGRADLLVKDAAGLECLFGGLDRSRVQLLTPPPKGFSGSVR